MLKVGHITHKHQIVANTCAMFLWESTVNSAHI